MDLTPYIAKPLAWLKELGVKPLHVEKIVTGNGYAGTCDLRGELPDGTLVVVDWKTTGKTQTDFDKQIEPWPEHAEQAAAYMTAWLMQLADRGRYVTEARCFVVYIGTKEPGAFKAFEVFDWREAYQNGFQPALTIWQRRKGYTPNTDTAEAKLDKAGL